MVATVVSKPYGPQIDITLAPYGVRGNGTTIQTDAIQAAIDDVAAAGGGDIVFPARYAGSRAVYVTRQLRLRSRVGLIAQHGWSAVLLRAADTNADLIVLDTVNVEMVTVDGLCLQGNKAHNTSGNGLSITNTGGSWTHSSPYHVFRNVFAELFNDAGFYFKDTLGSSVDNCHAKNNDGRGFDVATTDSFFHACTAATNGLSGFYVTNGNNRFSICKAYTSGQRIAVASDEADGFLNSHAGRNQYVGCEAQDNRRHGFVAIGSECKGTIFSACVADSNAVSSVSTFGGYVLDACSHVQIVGCAADNVRTTQNYGLILANSPSANVVRMISVGQGNADLSDSGGAAASNVVEINGVAA